MPQNFYIRFKGRVLGPMSTEKMRDLIQRGQVTRMHEISGDGLHWQKAEEFPGLYPQTVKAVEVELAKSENESANLNDAVNLLPAPETMAQPTTEWFVNINGQQVGPADEATVRNWCSAGRVTSETLVWKNGLNDWMPAATVRPAWFDNGMANQVQSQTHVQAKVSAGKLEHLDSLVQELRSRQLWVYTLAITTLVISVFYLIGTVFAMIGQLVAPAESGGQAIVAMIFTVFALGICIIAFLACVNLLRYANALSILSFAPTQENLLHSFRKLSRFWLYSGICVLTFLVVIGATALLIYAAGLRINYLIGR